MPEPLAVDPQSLVPAEATPTNAALVQVLTTLTLTRQAATVESYRQDLLRCGQELGCHDPVAVLRALINAGPGGCYRILASWVGRMRDQGLAQLTIHRRAAGVQAVLRHVHRHGLIAWRIGLDRHDLGAAIPRRDTRGPSSEQVRSILAAAAAQADPVRAARDVALLWLLAGCGLRSAEVRSLTVGHVDLGRSEVRIRGKGRHEREAVPLPQP